MLGGNRAVRLLYTSFDAIGGGNARDPTKTVATLRPLSKPVNVRSFLAFTDQTLDDRTTVALISGSDQKTAEAEAEAESLISL
jgi:hypothetical protein